jgi:hypothetical protein
MITVLTRATLAEAAPLALARYLAALTALVEHLGGRLGRRISLAEFGPGGRPGSVILICQLPDHAAANALLLAMQTPTLHALGQQAFESHSVMLAGGEQGQDAPHRPRDPDPPPDDPAVTMAIPGVSV